MSESSRSISATVKTKVPGYEDVEFEVKGVLIKTLDRSAGWMSSYTHWDSFEIYHNGVRMTDLLDLVIRDRLLEYAESDSAYEKSHGFKKPNRDEG